MSVFLLSRDLLFSSQVSGAALPQGVAVRTFGEADQVIEACRQQPVQLLLVDLALARLEIGTLIECLRALESPPGRILAFGPHVHEAKLSAARQAGCDEVFTRGQLHARLDRVFAEIASRE